MKFRFFKIAFLSCFMVLTLAQGEVTGELECDDICYYTPVNITASALRNKIRIEIYKTGEPLYPDVLQVSGDDSQLIFYTDEPKKMNAIKKRIFALDKKNKFVKNVGGQAMILVQIHALETQGIDQFRFAWEGSIDKNRTSVDIPRTRIGPENGTFKMDFNFGNLKSSLFKFAFDFSKTKAWSHRAASWTVFKRNEEDLAVSNMTNLYRHNDKSITTEKESAGFTVYGKVYLSSNNLIKIKNFSLNYSQPTGEHNSLVSTFNLSNMSFDLEPGKTRFLALNKVYMKTSADKESFIFFQDKVADSNEVNLLFSISAELADENQQDMNIDYSLSEEEISKLPSGDDKGLQQLIQSVLPYKAEGNILDIFGKKTGIQLNKKFLTQTNYDKYLTVKITNPAFDNLIVLEQKIKAQDLTQKPLFYNFVDEFDKRCKQNSKLCLTTKLVLEIGIDKDREIGLSYIPNSKFIISDDPVYSLQKIVGFDEKLLPAPNKKFFWNSNDN